MKIGYLVLSAVLVFAGIQAQVNAAIVLGSASGFGLLGGSAVSNTGSSVIVNGSVGSAPTPAVSGFPPATVINGILYTTADPVTAQAHADLMTAYTAAQTASGGTAGPADLGGASLSPGIYTFSTAAAWTAGTLTLDASGDANAQWIFQIGTTLTTPAGATVALLNGASADRVFWAVGSSATLGATNTFAGNILAQSSITLGGGSLEGRALAIDGLVSITVAETVNVPIPEPCTMLLLGSGAMALVAARKRRTSAA